MDPNLVTAAPLATPEAAMSIWALILQADLVVKAVMLVLALASLWCWAVIFEKVWRLASLKRRTTLFERAFWSGAPLEELYKRLAKRPVRIERGRGGEVEARPRDDAAHQ